MQRISGGEDLQEFIDNSDLLMKMSSKFNWLCSA